MNALTLLQPWATLAVLGFKTWETRSRNIGIPLGPLLIHSSKRVDNGQGLIVYDEFRRAFPEQAKALPFWRDMIRGAIVGKVRVTSTMHADAEFGIMPSDLTDMAKMLGDFTPGRYFARLEQPEQFQTPIYARGYQGIFRFEMSSLSEPE